MKRQAPNIKQFCSDPKVKNLLGSCKNFIALARKHLNESDGLAIIKKEISPVIIPVELETDIVDLWDTTIEHLKIAGYTE